MGNSRLLVACSIAWLTATSGAQIARADDTASPSPKPVSLASDVDHVLAFGDLKAGPTFIGPQRIFIVGINPLLYPNWVLRVDGTVVSGPASLFGTTGGSMPTPFPLVSPGAVAAQATSGFIPSYDVNGIAPTEVSVACDAAVNDYKTINSCNDQAEKELQAILDLVGRSEEVVHFKVQRTSVQDGKIKLGSPNAGSQAAALSSAIQSYNGLVGRGNMIAAERPNDKDEIASFRAEVQRVLDDAAQVRNSIHGLQDWPAARVALAKQHFTILTSALAAKPKICLKDDKNDSSVDAACKQVNNSAAGALKVLNDLAPDSRRATEYADRLSKLRDADTNVLSKLSQDRFGTFSQTQCGGLLSGGREQTLTLSLDGTQTVAFKVLCPGRVFTSYGLAFSRVGTHNYVANAAPATPSPVPTAATGTSARAPLDAATPTPGAGLTTVQDNGPGKYSPIFLTMAHFALYQPREGDRFLNSLDNGGVFGSLGLGLGGNGSSGAQNPLQVDFMYGISVAAYRSLIFTVGQHFGREQSLAPGYTVGQPIVAIPGSNVPTVTTYHFRPFFSFTLGKQQ